MHIAVFALLIGVLIIPLGMDGIDGKIGMMPVDQKIIKADMQSFRPEDVVYFESKFHMENIEECFLDQIPRSEQILDTAHILFHN